MKRFLSIALILVMLFSFSSCDSEREIKSVKIGDKTYYSLFLYSFTDAEIPEEYSEISDTPIEEPAESGYAITKDKDAEVIEVFEQFMRKNTDLSESDSNNSYSVTSGYTTVAIKANVKELIESFPITIEHKSDTYVITYYTYEYSTDTDKDRLIEKSLEKTTIEVVKDNVVIEYYN